jgi:RNA polymerase sigma-70 factor (ECF subfamily)
MMNQTISPSTAFPEIPEAPIVSPAEQKRSTDRAARLSLARAEALLDADLIAQFVAGDEAAFIAIVHRYREKVLAQACRFLRNPADAEEIAQDTFVRAHRGLATFRGDSSLATWLYRITINLARNRYWHLFRRRQHLTLSLDCPLTEASNRTFSDVVPTTDADPARQATVAEFEVMVSACMEKLDVGQREILTLRNLLHHSYDEIALSLGINTGTVKSRIARARGSLRGLLAETYPDFPADGATNDWFEPVRGAAQVAA